MRKSFKILTIVVSILIGLGFVIPWSAAYAWYCPTGTTENPKTHVCELNTPVIPPPTTTTVIPVIDVPSSTPGMCGWLWNTLKTHVDVTQALKWFLNINHRGYHFTKCEDDRHFKPNGMPYTEREWEALPQP